MARIKTYSVDVNVVDDDKWIGSDSQNNYSTKNFTAKEVAKYINQRGNQLQSLRFKYQNVETTPVTAPAGSLLFDPTGADNVAFSSISSWILSKVDLIELTLDISGFYTSPLIASDVLVTQCSDINNWAVYTWDSSVQNIKNINFYDIGLTYRSGNGGLIESEDYFISLLTYSGSGIVDKTYVFTQAVPATTWSINHNLEKFPSVSVVNSNNILINGEVTYIDNNNVELNFSAGFAGKAYLN